MLDSSFIDDFIKLQKAEHESEKKVSKAHIEWCKIITQDMQHISRRLEALEYHMEKLLRER